MSAFFAAKYDDRIEILTDGAVYTEDGTIADFQKKIWTSDRLPLAFAGRGSSISTSMMGSVVGIMSYRGTFDETFMTFKEKIEGRADKGKDQVAMDGLFAGISETLGPVMYYFHTYQGDREEFGHVEPFKIYDAGTEMQCASSPGPRDFRDSGLPMYWACDGLEEYGGKFFDLLRRHPMKHLTHPDQPLVYGIGGHVDHTVITAEGITTKRIHVWPEDQIGQKIEPTGCTA